MSVGTTCPTVAIDSKTITDTHHLPHLSSVLDFPLPLRLPGSRWRAWWSDLFPKSPSTAWNVLIRTKLFPFLTVKTTDASLGHLSVKHIPSCPALWSSNPTSPKWSGLMAWLLWGLFLWLLACCHINPKVTSGSHSFVLSRALAGGSVCSLRPTAPRVAKDWGSDCSSGTLRRIINEIIPGSTLYSCSHV